MNSLFSAIAVLGIVIIGLMVMVGALKPADAIGRIVWLVVALISADIALGMLERFVIAPLIAAVKQALPIALAILGVFAALLFLALIAAALMGRLRNDSPRHME